MSNYYLEFSGQLGAIKEMNLASLLCMTTGIGDVTLNPFKLPAANSYVLLLSKLYVFLASNLKIFC